MNSKAAPAMAPNRVNIPNSSVIPTMIKPQIFKKSTISNNTGLSGIALKMLPNHHCASKRYHADVQVGLNTFDIPSYKKCQPINNLRIVNISLKLSGYDLSFFIRVKD